MKILCIGMSTYDITYQINKAFSVNDEFKIKDRVECGGGIASNIAYLLGKWNQEVYYAGIIGNDKHGKAIKEELESVNVNTDNVELKKNIITTVNNIIVSKTSTNKTIFTYCPDEAKLDDIDLNFNPDIILTDGYDCDISKKVIEAFPNSISILCADKLNEETEELAKIVNCLICTSNFAQSFSHEKFDFNNSNTILSIYKKLKDSFKGEIIITLDSRGTLYMNDGKIKIMPSLEVEIKDIVGSHDFFAGAFIYALINNYKREDAVRMSNIASSLSYTKIGSKISCPSLEEVLKIYEEY